MQHKVEERALVDSGATANFIDYKTVARLRLGTQKLDNICYDHSPGAPFFLAYGLPRTTMDLPSPPQCYPDSCFVYLLRSHYIYRAAFHDHRFIRLTYLMPRFDSYCMYHRTLDPLPIRLVVDRPWWTSSVYIRSPLLR